MFYMGLFILAIIFFVLYYLEKDQLAGRMVSIFLGVIFFVTYYQVMIHFVEWIGIQQLLGTALGSLLVLFITIVLIFPFSILSSKKVMEIVKSA